MDAYDLDMAKLATRLRSESMLTIWVVFGALLQGACTPRVPVAAHPVADTASPKPNATVHSNVPLMPHAVTSFGAAAYEGHIYTLGGYAGTPHAYSVDGQSGELWQLDANSSEFTRVAEVPRLQGAALVAVPGGVLRVGGMRAKNRSGEAEDMHSVDEVALFSPSDGAFRALPALERGRSSHAAAFVAGKVYVVGGWTLAGGKPSGSFAASGLAIDPADGSTLVISQPFQRRALAAAALDGALVVLGGLDEKGMISRETWAFSPASQTWSRGQDFPGDGFGIAATSNGDTLVASDREGVLYALDTPTSGWRALGKLAFPRFFHQLAMRDATHVAVLGGISGMHAGARIRAVEIVDITSAAARVLTFSLDNPLRAKNRQGVFVHTDSLYVFGGNRSLAQHDFGADDFVREGARLDLAALAFAPMASFPEARQTVQTWQEGDKAYALGGFGFDGEKARAHGDAFAYSIDQDTWTRVPDVLPSPRTQFGVAEFEGTRWVFGGLDFDPTREGEAQFEHPRAVLKGVPGQPFVASDISLPRARRAFGGALLEGQYYLVGGMAAGFATVRECDVLALRSATWSEIPCPTARVSPQLVALDGKLYLAGGSRPNASGELEPVASLERYDPATKTWTTLVEQLPITPKHLSMQAFHGALLLYSAHREEARVDVALVVPPL